MAPCLCRCAKGPPSPEGKHQSPSFLPPCSIPFNSKSLTLAASKRRASIPLLLWAAETELQVSLNAPPGCETGEL